MLAQLTKTGDKGMSTKMTPMKKVQHMIATRKSELAKMLPEHISIDRFERAANNALMRNPDIASCDGTSVYDSLMRCAQDGLNPDGREAAIVVFGGKGGKKAQYMPMVDGLLKLMRQSREVSNVVYGVVLDGDDFSYKVENGVAKLSHEPDVFADDDRKFKGVYAVVTLNSGEQVIEVMGKREVDKVRAVSRSGSSSYGPWAQWYDRMAIKSVIRRVVRRLPSSAELDSVTDSIDREIDARFDNARDITPKGSVVEETSAPADFMEASNIQHDEAEQQSDEDMNAAIDEANQQNKGDSFDPENF